MKMIGVILLILSLIKPYLAVAEGDVNLFVFVGEQISLEDFEPELEEDELLMDEAFIAKYKIIEPVFGKYKGEEIEFVVYDHYGSPEFSKYDHVLLFVSAYEGGYYHQKYLYFDVYITTDGRWATCGDPYKLDGYHRKDLKAENIEFVDTISYDVAGWSKDDINKQYPKELFQVSDNKAHCLGKGSYIEDLLKVKIEGVLKARGVTP